MQPSLDADHLAQPGNGRIGRGPEEIHTHAEEEGIKPTRDNDPFPQLMLGDEEVSLGIGLDGNYDFFEQGGFLLFYLCYGYCLAASNLKYLFGGWDKKIGLFFL
jgi:hypothetical protein